MLWNSKFYLLHVSLVGLLLGASLETVSAAQCVWNKAGFVLKARWYNPDDIGAIKVEEVVDGEIKTKFITGAKAGKTPVQVDQWPTGQGRCTRGANANKELTVILSVVDGKVASDFVKIGGGIAASLIGTATAAAAGVGCTVATAGLACPAVVVGIGAYTVAATTGLSQIPDAAEVFYIDKPSSTHYLDVWGTVWSPQSGQGGKSPSGELGWVEARAHDKGCWDNKKVYHVRCEFLNNNQWSHDCPDMTTAGTFKGKKILSVERLGDRAWTEVKLEGGC
ncbi:MAG: hypothetical protein V2J55_05120 [Candidatus Competibacteraceae bacterium]|jgi:hypothetical protein|nr:hypothetical protein [Candidatus Competibacteraceae bacterium]